MFEVGRPLSSKEGHSLLKYLAVKGVCNLSSYSWTQSAQYFCRNPHTISTPYIQRRVGGWYDTGLTEQGKRQADAAAKRLVTLCAGKNVSIVSSDLKRAAETATIIGGHQSDNH